MKTSNEIAPRTRLKSLAVERVVDDQTKTPILRLSLRLPRRLDLRKPAQAILAGTLIFTLVLPLLEAALLNNRYTIQAATRPLLSPTSPHLMEKLKYDAASKVYRFNEDAKQKQAENAVEAGAGKFAADFFQDPSSGITLFDPANGLNLKFTPQFSTLDGREKDGHIVYPLLDGKSQLVYTIKGNGLKEDILIERPIGDKASYSYRLELGESLEARLLDSGALGIYSSDAILHGNITFGSDADREKVEQARQNGAKNNLVFAVPAPIIRDSSGKEYADRAKFSYKDGILTVESENLRSLAYPITIDPSFAVTSASDWGKGNNDSNIEFDNAGGQIKRAAITGGMLGSWGAISGTAYSTARTGAQLVAANGYLYLTGGWNGTTAMTEVAYAPIQSNGNVGNWATTTSLGEARFHHNSVAINNRLYVAGGFATTSTYVGTTEFATINSDGTLGAWSTPTGMGSSARGALSSAVYNNIFYNCCGKDQSITNSGVLHYAVKADGNLAGLGGLGNNPVGRNFGGMVAYNGYLYLIAGMDNLSTIYNRVDYARILSDGTLGTWQPASNLNTARFAHGAFASGGHLYAVGGCTAIATGCTAYANSTEVATINADGSIGAWATTATITTARAGLGATSYNGHVYMTGGCVSLNGPTSNWTCGALGGDNKSDTQYAKVDSPGVTGSFNTTSGLTTARSGFATAVSNGYVYVAGGCSATVSCSTGDVTNGYLREVLYAKLNTDGTIPASGSGSWSLFSNMIATGADKAGRLHPAMAINNGYLYIIGGAARNALGTANAYKSDVLFAKINSTGGVVTSGVCTPAADWCASTNNLQQPRWKATATTYNGSLYVLGGSTGTTDSKLVDQTTFKTDATGDVNAFTAAPQTGSDHAFGSAIAYNQYLYIFGGSFNTSVERATIRADGTLHPTVGWATSGIAQLPAGRTAHALAAMNGRVYLVAGYTTTYNANILSNTLNTDGTIGDGASSSWSTNPTSLGTARDWHGSAIANGYIYAIGGCNADDGSGNCTAFLSSVEYSKVQNGGSGGVSWKAGNTSLGTYDRWLPQVTAHQGRFYVVGGSWYNSNGTNSVKSGTINGDGSITWVDEPNAPPHNCSGGGDDQEGPYAGGLVAYADQLFLIGGARVNCNAAQNLVYRTKLDAAGRIVTTVPSDCPAANIAKDNAGADTVWCSEGGMLSGSRAYHSTILYQNYIYIVAGTCDSNTGVCPGSGSVFYPQRGDYAFAKIETNPALQAVPGVYIQPWTWPGLNNQLPTKRKFTAGTVYNGHIYVFGGTHDTTGAYSDGYYSKLNPSDTTSGNAGLTTPAGCTPADATTWCPIGLPFKITGASVVAANGFMTLVGGGIADSIMWNGSITASINSNGSLGNWNYNTGAIPTPRFGAGVAYMDGVLMMAGGSSCVCGAGAGAYATENHGTFLAQPRVGRYSRVLDADVDVAPTKLLTNGSLLSSSSALTLNYKTAPLSTNTFGSASSVGVTVGTPQTFPAPSGGVAKAYWLNYILDDTQSASFPDSATTLSDLIFWYHPNPARRLRGGKTFTGGAQQSLDAAP